MTAVTDFTTVIETLIGRSVPGPQLKRIGERFKEADPYELGVFADPANPTNEELAQLGLDTILTYSKRLVRGAAEVSERTTINEELEPANVAQRINNAADTAEADIT